MQKIAFYGTLKKGHYNHKRFTINLNTFLGQSKVSGAMQMCRLGYPFLFKKSKDLPYTAEYDLEVYEIEDKLFEVLKGMELNSGYYEDKIETEYGVATIFYADMKLHNADDPYISEFIKDVV